MRKFFFMLSLLFILNLFISFFPGDKVYADEALVDSEYLNVRTGPGTEYGRITRIYSGEVYSILQTQDNWVEIDLGDETGWVIDEYITITTSLDESQIYNEEEKNETVDISSLVITTNNTQVRSGPSVDYDIIGFVNKAETYEVIAADDEWYEIEFNKEQGYIFKELINEISLKKNQSFKNKVIVVDAGHGGHDVGAIGASGVYESDLTYKTAMELKHELSMLGADVILTRKNNDYVRLASRSALSNLKPTDAFISIHYNSFPEQRSATGINSYYYQEQDNQLAASVQQGIIDSTNSVDRGVAYGNYQILRTNYKPAILVELDFISNPNREQLLLTTAHQKKIVEGIINGLSHYFSNK